MRPAGLAEVLDAFGPAYLATRPLPRGGAKVWRAITACRTAALGGHLEACDGCGQRRHVYHSCRNRHCPQCQTRAKEAWLAARRREVLPVPYFHLVFTLPHALNGLVAVRPRALYELLFASVAATLAEFAASPRHLGGVPAFSLVLHTWTQDLRRHIHVHALVAGGALGPSGEWRRPKKGFLFPVRALSRVLRGKFVAGLERFARCERWPSGADWARLKPRLYDHDWVVYAKQPLGGPEAVLEYLGRYTHRVAISNERILGIDADQVALRVRAEAGSAKKRTLRLSGVTFIDRFLLHVLPAGFKRIRHYGLLSPARKRAGLAAARAALDVPAPSAATVETVADFLRRVAHLEHQRCPCCGSGQMRVVAVLAPARQILQPRGPP